MAKVPPPVLSTPVLTTAALLAKLLRVQHELEGMSPAPRVEVDRDAILDMIRLCRAHLQALTEVH